MADQTESVGLHGKRFKFLALPVELRLEIYKYTLTSSAPCLRHGTSLARDVSNERLYSFCDPSPIGFATFRSARFRDATFRDATGPDITLAILELNQQTHDEAIQVFYENNDFQIKVEETNREQYNKKLGRTPPAIKLLKSTLRVDLIQKISLKSPCGWVMNDMVDELLSWYINSIRIKCPSLRFMTLHLLPNLNTDSKSPRTKIQEALKHILPALTTLHLNIFGPLKYCTEAFTAITGHEAEFWTVHGQFQSRKASSRAWPGVFLSAEDLDNLDEECESFAYRRLLEKGGIVDGDEEGDGTQVPEVRGARLRGGQWKGKKL